MDPYVGIDWDSNEDVLDLRGGEEATMPLGEGGDALVSPAVSTIGGEAPIPAIIDIYEGVIVPPCGRCWS